MSANADHTESMSFASLHIEYSHWCLSKLICFSIEAVAVAIDYNAICFEEKKAHST